jgi:hypothetical protein
MFNAMTAHFGIHDFGMIHNELNTLLKQYTMNERTSDKHAYVIGVLAVKDEVRRITVLWGVTLRRREPRDRRRILVSQTNQIFSDAAVKNSKTHANIIMIFGSFGHLHRS